jgi:hypothetical protein
LEYSESKDASYCFYCFLFKKLVKGDKYESFTKVGTIIGKMRLKSLKLMWVVLIVSTTMLDCILMILVLLDHHGLSISKIRDKDMMVHQI